MVNAITTLATVAIATLSAAAPLSTRAPTCVSGLYIIVARGSTEAPGEGEPGKVADMIVARVPHSTSVAVDYPATLENYNASVAAGVADATQKVKDYVSACGSNSRIALLGYSQGGEVMTNMLSGPGQIDSSYMKYIKGVAVFGDPTFTAAQPIDAGSATTSGRFTRSGSSLATLDTYSKVLRSYCTANDYFCASGSSLNVHYAEVATYAQAATDFVVMSNMSS